MRKGEVIGDGISPSMRKFAVGAGIALAVSYGGFLGIIMGCSL